MDPFSEKCSGGTEYKQTKEALKTLEKLLICCQCSQLSKNVCTLGNCEHLFCKTCLEKCFGKCCPLCSMPSHVKDAQVSRHLSFMVSLCQELDRLLQNQNTPMGSTGMKCKEAYAIPPTDTGWHSVTATDRTDICKSDQDGLLTPLQPKVINIENLAKSTLGQSHLSDLCQKTAKLQKESENHSNSAQQQSVSFTKIRRICQTNMSRRQRPHLRKEKSHKFKQETASPFFIAEQESQHSDSSLLDVANVNPKVPIGKIKPTAHLKAHGTRGKNRLGKSFPDSVNSPICVQNNSSALPSDSACGQFQMQIISPASSSLPCLASKEAIQSEPPQSKKKLPELRSEFKNQNTLMQAAECSSKENTSRSNSIGYEHHLPHKSKGKRTGHRFSSHSSLLFTGNKVKRNAKGETPLHVAAIKGDISTIKKLLDKGDNPNVRDNAGWTPLHEAVNHGYCSLAELLLRHGAMVNYPGLENDTPLHDAVANNRLDCIKILMAYGASKTARNIHGKTPLELCESSEIKAALEAPVVQERKVDMPPLEDMEEFMPLCFLGTALSREQQSLLQKCAAKLGAKVVEEYTSEVTHVVSSCNKNGQCPRTLKYLQAVLGGKWIVNLEWISMCLEYGEKVSEEPFEIPGSSTHSNSRSAYRARMNHKHQLPGLFDGCQVFLHGAFTNIPPSRKELVELLQQGGAHLLTREPHLLNIDEYEVTVPYHAFPDSSLVDCGIFIVHDESANVPKIEAERMRSVSASWVVKCIDTFSLVEPSSV